MEEHYLQKISFEPDWCALFVDGELFREGHDYDSEDFLIDAINEYDGNLRIDTYWTQPDEWFGVPETFEELEETYPEI